MQAQLNIVADAHIWGVKSAFSKLPGFEVALNILENNQINRHSLRHADILLTRSSTRVNADLLSGSGVRFAATATIGDDHYDKDWLDAHAITWANAAGSSTGAVLEYMLTVLLDLHQRDAINIPDSCIGIIGAGRIGSALAELCRAMGMQVMLNDPPRARQAQSPHSTSHQPPTADTFHRLDELLEQADILTLHTPFIDHGNDCTHHLLAEQQLSRFKGKGIINAARGACLDNAALYDWLDRQSEHFAVLDCWENEPAPLRRLLQHPNMLIATPHIAGHSLDGKAANSQFIYHALCQYLNVAPEWDMQAELAASPPPVNVSGSGSGLWHSLHAAATTLYPIANDYIAMQTWANLTDDELAAAFKTYRRHYPVRRAWQHCPVHFQCASPAANRHILHMAQAIGIKTV